MKKIVALLLVLISFSSCDDGELNLESFNFENQIIEKCLDESSYLIFKTKNDELLLVSFEKDDYERAFANTPASVTTPREFTINAPTQVLYRKYTGNVSPNTVCAVIPSATPIVSKEWVATGGTITVVSTEVIDPATGLLTHYIHNITFLNVNFASADNSFSFESYNYGGYKLSAN